jgi:hypothetical protein
MSLESLVDGLYADSDVQRMLALSTHSEPLQICYPKEVNVSRFLAWLLDPTQGHGLGDQAIKSLLTRAGMPECSSHLALGDRRFLAASNIQTLAFSSFTLMTEAELGLPGKHRYIDVLAVDPAAKLYIAIENKFGHHEGVDQTQTYYDALRQLFPASYRGIHLFLDSNEGEPKCDQWIAIGYTWLTEFLSQAEQLNWVAPHVKSTMAQFRRAVQEEDELAEGNLLGTLVTSVASQHGEALDALHKILTANAPRSRAKDLAKLVSAGASNDAKANIRLFQLYGRRPQVWDQCLKERKFARFHCLLNEQFKNLTSDPRRVVTFFSLEEFERLLDPDLGTIWAAAISVRQDGDHFRVTTYISFSCVKKEYRAQLLEVAKEERARNDIRRSRQDDGTLIIQRGASLAPVKAAEEAAAQLLVLRRLLKDIS